MIIVMKLLGCGWGPC